MLLDTLRPGIAATEHGYHADRRLSDVDHLWRRGAAIGTDGLSHAAVDLGNFRETAVLDRKVRLNRRPSQLVDNIRAAIDQIMLRIIPHSTIEATSSIAY